MKISQRTMAEATGMSEQEVAAVWEKMSESPFRKVIQYEVETRQTIERQALDNCAPDDLKKHQGIVQGMTICLGIMARKDPPNKVQR